MNSNKKTERRRKMEKVKKISGLGFMLICSVILFSCQLMPLSINSESTEKLSAGGFHTCIITSLENGKCWGRNNYGQLGDGTNTDSNVPVDVSDLTSSLKGVSSGIYHTCIITSEGAVKCWGYNRYGQLGDGTNADSNVPVEVSGLSEEIKAISASDKAHTCAITTQGAVKCWGYNRYGQLGDGSTIDGAVPVDVSGLSSGMAAISTGSYHTCAVDQYGRVKCWGDNRYGQLGDGTYNNSMVPVDASDLSSGAKAISAGGGHACALTPEGAVKCWGDNYYGQLGDGTHTNRNIPVDVSGLSSGVTAISAGQWHTCALTSEGAVKCWGKNDAGQLGDGTWEDSTIPVDVSGLSSGGFVISAGGAHTCAFSLEAGLKCWGDDSYGQLGDGMNRGGNGPVSVVEFCGNYVCDLNEDENSCPSDCTVCGNGICGAYEDESSCPEDCGVGAYCGDGYCDPGEYETCPEDCLF